MSALRVHGIRMAVQTKLIPKILKFQGILISELVLSYPGFWFEAEVNLFTNKIDIAIEPTYKHEYLDRFRYTYAKDTSVLQLIKEEVESTVDWLRVIHSLDEEQKGVWAEFTYDKKFQITLVF